MALEKPEGRNAADAITEAAEQERLEIDRFRRQAAIVIGIMAMLLAIASLGGGNATKEMLNANIQASDTYAFYQAKNIRQTSYQLASQDLQSLLSTHPEMPPDAQTQVRDTIAGYEASVARFESEPETGEGKQELLSKAQAFEQRRDRAARQDPNFDYAQALYQIGIVLGSVSIVAASRRLLVLAVVLGAVATLLAVNGILLLVELPLG
jgi:Domain of unknown function (DUF4337)